MAILGAFPIPVPTGAEQRAVVDEVEAQESVCDAVQKQLDAEAVRTARLDRAILKRAFDGKLVPQNPRDEPASELLDRIGASREIAAKAGFWIRKKIRKKCTII